MNWFRCKIDTYVSKLPKLIYLEIFRTAEMPQLGLMLVGLVFRRHQKKAEVGAENKETPWKDAGYVAWLGWGGTSGINWASKKLQQIDKK